MLLNLFHRVCLINKVFIFQKRNYDRVFSIYSGVLILDIFPVFTKLIIHFVLSPSWRRQEIYLCLIYSQPSLSFLKSTFHLHDYWWLWHLFLRYHPVIKDWQQQVQRHLLLAVMFLQLYKHLLLLASYWTLKSGYIFLFDDQYLRLRKPHNVK